MSHIVTNTGYLSMTPQEVEQFCALAEFIFSNKGKAFLIDRNGNTDRYNGKIPVLIAKDSEKLLFLLKKYIEFDGPCEITFYNGSKNFKIIE